MKRELTKDEQMVRDTVYRMSKPERIKYYISVYKWYAVAVVAVIAMVISIVHSILTARTDVLFLGVLNKSTYCSDVMVDAYYEYSDMDTKKYEVALYDSLGSGPEYYQGGYNLVTMYIAADELNLCFTDKEGADFIGVNGIVADPKRWMSDDLYNLWKDRIVTIPVITDTMDMSDNPPKEDMAVAIDLTGTKVMEEFKLEEDTNLLICVIDGKFTDELKRYSQFLYELETGSFSYVAPAEY